MLTLVCLRLLFVGVECASAVPDEASKLRGYSRSSSVHTSRAMLLIADVQLIRRTVTIATAPRSKHTQSSVFYVLLHSMNKRELLHSDRCAHNIYTISFPVRDAVVWFGFGGHKPSVQLQHGLSHSCELYHLHTRMRTYSPIIG